MEEIETVIPVKSLVEYSDEELVTLIEEAKELIVQRKIYKRDSEIQVALDKYTEVNDLGKRIYNLTEVSQITGVSVTRIKNALKKDK